MKIYSDHEENEEDWNWTNKCFLWRSLDQFLLHTHPQHHHCWPPSPLWQMVPPKAYFSEKKSDCQNQSQLDRIFWNISKFSLLNNNVGMGQTIGVMNWHHGSGDEDLLNHFPFQPIFSTAGWFEWIPSVGRMTELMDSLSSSDDRIGGFPQQVGCWNCQQVDSLSRSEDRIDGFPQQL